ncbi:MAG TPA: hypothetical protein VG055_16405 [Planctomycetaceae bacterium]|jgi:hypothetical protein|nr:hypothetical protein [Planctomycetaceae bacterium]
MSDEPRKRSRAWIGWTALTLFVLYPLSFGPVVRFREYNPVSFETMASIYLPLELATRKCEPLRRALDWYIKLWKD